jgi:hypothetical protein
MGRPHYGWGVKMKRVCRIAFVGAALVALSTAASADSPRAKGQFRVSETPIDTRMETLPRDDVPQADVPQAIVGHSEVEGVIGKEVRSIANESIGRIIQVVVDRFGQVRAAVIDFGGFFGVGSRKIAVDWSMLQFDPAGDPRGHVLLKLTRDQVKAAPEYKPGKPVVIMGALRDDLPLGE